jgi:hypothetical protein
MCDYKAGAFEMGDPFGRLRTGDMLHEVVGAVLYGTE